MWSVSQAGMAMIFGAMAHQQRPGGVVQKTSGVHGRGPQNSPGSNRSRDDERSDFHALFLRALEEDDME
ncbi:MAG: hypothetical protein H7833_19595 [Magnetococcus sp. DMHC-1]|nr:hypothetical protein [Magnetococcales bacterium]MBF0423774.1 hypothetical protein [Magnetococcales bacterium]